MAHAIPCCAVLCCAVLCCAVLHFSHFQRSLESDLPGIVRRQRDTLLLHVLAPPE